jgi:hypothetical protein
VTAAEVKNQEFVFNLKSIDDISKEVMAKISEADKIISDCNLRVSVDNDGIGHYEFWGQTGNDKGVNYLVVDECKKFDLKFVFEEGIPERTQLNDLEEHMLGDFLRTRTYNYGGDERRDGLDIDLKLIAKGSKIEGNTFSCTVTWADANL